MNIGVSTASLYPLYTEEALLTLARHGVKNVEIFLNSVREAELTGKVFSSLLNTVNEYGLNVLSLHPFSSPLETQFLFSAYERRVAEITDLYKRYFEVMNRLNAKIFVVHGAILSAKCPDSRYTERLYGLIETGRSMGITVAQENVCYCRSGRLEFLEMLRRELGGSAAFVLDIKQARRSGYEPSEILNRLGDSIVHLHLSDCGKESDCMKIGAGDFGFAEFFAQLKKIGYKGGAVVELYRENYGEYSELADCVEILQKISHAL